MPILSWSVAQRALLSLQFASAMQDLWKVSRCPWNAATSGSLWWSNNRVSAATGTDTGMHWSLREEETRKGRERGGRVKGEWREGAGRGGVDGDEDFFASRTTNDSSQTSGGEWKRLVSPAFSTEVCAGGLPQLNHSVSVSLALLPSLLRLIYRKKSSLLSDGVMQLPLALLLSRALSSLAYSH